MYGIHPFAAELREHQWGEEMQAIQAGSTLLVVWIDRNTGGCEAPADGGSADTGSFVWCSGAVIGGW